MEYSQACFWALPLALYGSPRGPYNDVDMSFFEQEKVYDLFENDNDHIVNQRKRSLRRHMKILGRKMRKKRKRKKVMTPMNMTTQTQKMQKSMKMKTKKKYMYKDEEDSYEEAEIENNLTTQNPTSKFEYTPDPTSCPSLHLPCLHLCLAVDSESSPCPHSTPTLSPTPLPIPSLMAPHTQITAPTQILSLFSRSTTQTRNTHTYMPAPLKKWKHQLRIKNLEKKLAKIKNLDFVHKWQETCKGEGNGWTSWLSWRRPLKIMWSQCWKRVKYGIHSVMNPRFEVIPTKACHTLLIHIILVFQCSYFYSYFLYIFIIFHNWSLWYKVSGPTLRVIYCQEYIRNCWLSAKVQHQWWQGVKLQQASSFGVESSCLWKFWTALFLSFE